MYSNNGSPGLLCLWCRKKSECRKYCLHLPLKILIFFFSKHSTAKSSNKKFFLFRSQVESVAAERDALKETLVKFTEEKEMLIVESEDTAQKLEKLHETKMR